MKEQVKKDGVGSRSALRETGPCVKCEGAGKYFDRRIGDVECDECQGHGWFNEGVAGSAMDAPHEPVCAVWRGGKCTCTLLDALELHDENAPQSRAALSRARGEEA